MKRLELACFSVRDALIAASLGVDRIEFCDHYYMGGITPVLSDFDLLRTSFPDIPIHVMIRPRSGNFVHSSYEIGFMLDQIDAFESSDADGFVFGVVTAQMRINHLACSRMIEAAKGKPCVFHRAFDLLQDPKGAIEELIDLDFSAVLTSGGKPTAAKGVEEIEALHKQFGQRIQIVAGGGIRSNNICTFEKASIDWLHSAAWAQEGSRMDSEEVERLLAWRSSLIS